MKVDIFEIDKNGLDEEWVNQQRNYAKSARAMADAREELERAKASEEVSKDELKLVDAELELDIRKNPSKFDLDKVTEGAVEKAVIIQERHRIALKETYKARNERIKAQHAYDIYQAEVYTLNNKKSAIESLVQLRLSDYFSEPRLKGAAGEEMKEAEENKAFSRRRIK